MSFSKISRVGVPRACLLRAEQHLRQFGQLGCEGFALWVGRFSAADAFTVTDTIIPEQQPLTMPDGVCVRVDGSELHRLNLYLFKNELRLIAQIHSHPTDAYHSDTDDTYPIATTVGAFSLVVPDFAAQPMQIATVATYRLSPAGLWAPLSPKTAQHIIQVEG